MLPVHRPSLRPPKRAFLPRSRSRLSLLAVLLVGSLTLFFFYLSDNDPPWPPPPTPLDHFPPPHHDPPLHKDDNAPSTPTSTPTKPHSQPTQEQQLWRSRANDVRSSFLHAWNAYQSLAWGFDEIQPLSGTPVQNFNGWGVSIVDSLDTLLLMDLRPQFNDAMHHVASLNFTLAPYEAAPFFETVIRYLGGLLSAYALVVDDNTSSSLSWRPELHHSRPSSTIQTDELESDTPTVQNFEKRDTANAPDPMFARQERNRIANILLTRADHLGRALLPAFNTTSGLPYFGVNTVSGIPRDHYTSLLAEIASCQMEYKYLAHITGRKEYFEATDKVIDLLESLQKHQLETGNSRGGMLPTRYTPATGFPSDDYLSVGGLADSAYEYFLKGYLMSRRTEPRLLQMYLESANTALRNLTYFSSERELVYITDATGYYVSHRLEHLSCFYPGLLALGAETLNSKEGKTGKFEIPPDVRQRHLWAAESIAESCWLMYADNPSGLGAEDITFDRPLADKVGKGVPTRPDRSFNLWWDKVDTWQKANPDGNTPPGIKGRERKTIVTNGGKGSWESTGWYPADNEIPLGEIPMMEAERAKGAAKSEPDRRHLRDYYVSDGRWLMRPETIESIYIMYRVTGDNVWRDRCYAIYQSIERHSKVPNGYASVRDVDFAIDERTKLPKGYIPEDHHWDPWKRHDDSMPSYALAETFKYLYLCMMDLEESKALLPVDKWVFNTEAHPLPIFSWSEEEMNEWGIH